MEDQAKALRLRGRIFALNDKMQMGHARLPDNERVWVDFSKLAQGSAVPKLGDYIEFEVADSADGPQAENIAVLPINFTQGIGKPSPSRPTQLQLSLSDEQEVGISEVANEPSAEVSEDVQRLYAEAAVARAESRIHDARSLFERALKAGAPVGVFVAYAKMEMERGTPAQAKAVVERALREFPKDATLYVMYGQMERRHGHLADSEKILRRGLVHNPEHILLRQGLGRVLADSGIAGKLAEANKIFLALDREGKLNKRDGSYQRFRALHQSPRAGDAYVFFERIGGFRLGVAGRRDLPRHVTDLVVHISNAELEASFGISGDYLIRCFDKQPHKSEIVELSKLLRSAHSQHYSLGLIEGGEAVINPGLAFVVVPGAAGVRDHLMSVLSENNEALIPIDDSLFESNTPPSEALRSLLAQFLGARDLYKSTLPVSGRRFFGREKLLVELTDQIHRGEFLGIYGLRKMGKTSLVWQLRDEKLRDDAVAYIDLQASSALVMHDFAPVYWELEVALYQRLKDHFPKAADLLRMGRINRFSDLIGKGLHAALIFSEDIRELLDHIATGSSPGLTRVVIVLDELERILPLAEQPVIVGYLEFFALIRGLAQTDRYRGLLSSVVIAANASISERGYWEGRENPVFALYKPIFLAPLSEKDMAEMARGIGKGMSVYWHEDALKLLFDEAGGHPFLTRLLSSKVVQRHPKRPLTVSKAMIQEAIPFVIRDETDKFAQIVELLQRYFPLEENFLERLAIGETLPDLGDDGLSHLLGYQLIRRDNNEYRLTLNLLTRWFKRRAGVANE